MGMTRRYTFVVALLAGATVSAQQPGPIERASVDQVAGDSAALRIYTDVGVAGGAEASGLTVGSVQAEIEGKPARAVALKRFSSTGEGVAYVFAVDVSRSVTPALFRSVQNEIRQFAERLRPVDRAAIVTFGDDTRIVTQFTGDKAALAAAVSGLTAQGHSTHLNLGLVEALRLARREDKKLPLRRAIIILSDGKDEGSGITADDVLRENDTNRIPIYSVGASQLPSEERTSYLDVLRRFSVLSGGEYYAIPKQSATGVYASIQDRITRVWEATFDCSACPTDGRTYPLLFTVNLNGATLSDRLNVIVTKAPTPPPASPRATDRRRLWWYYGGGGFILLAAIITAVATRRQKRCAPGEVSDPASVELISQPGLPEPLPSENRTPAAPPVAPGLKIELTRRSSMGGHVEAKLVNQLVAGRSSEAGLRLTDAGISGRHCMIELVDGRVLVSDLGSTHGTSINGVRINGRQRVESGDSISLGPIEFNLRIQEWH